jgi:PAS domain S-box-containing protein
MTGVFVLAPVLASLLALQQVLPAEREGPHQGGAAPDTVVAADLDAAGAALRQGRRVWITGELVRLGLPELDDDFAVADATGMVPLDFDPEVIENGALVAALLEGDRVEVTATVDRSIHHLTGRPATTLEVRRVEDIVFRTAPPFRAAAVGFGALALALLVVHLATRKRDAERRARELAEFTDELHRRDAILEAVGFAAERFLRSPSWEASLPEVLERLGLAAAAGRVTVHEVQEAAATDVVIAARAEWVSPGPGQEEARTPFDRASLSLLGLTRWRAVILEQRLIGGPVSDFPAEERAYLEARGIRSILVIPIWVGSVVWGVLVFTDHRVARRWSRSTCEVLVAAAGMIGAAVERTRAEQALLDAEDRFRQMAEHIREVYFMTDAETQEVLYLSPAYEEVWGRSREETLADPLAFVDAILPEDRRVMFDDIDLSARGDGARERQFEYRIRRPDGSIRWIRNRSFQIRSEDGRPYRVAGVCTDITEQKQLEEELRRAHRIEAMGHLAAGIAHEINTPIQYIGGNLHFLDEGYAELRSALAAYGELLAAAGQGIVPPEQVAGIAARVEAADLEFFLREAPRASSQALEGVQRVSEIVRAMKEFSHPGTGQRIPTDLNQAIRSTTTVARNEWKYVAELVTQLDDTLPLVPCLPGEVNQAILNLVVNAAHSIADRRDAEGLLHPGVITISTATVGAWAEIRVADTGTGIPEEIRQRIFDPFFTTKEVGRGTGQGLTFVHSIIVDKHGGTVSFDTEPGVGTTFVIRLPHHCGAPDLSEAA